MSEQAVDLIHEVAAELELEIGDEDYVYGEVHNVPVTMTCPSLDPLSLNLAFKIAAEHADSMIVPARIQSFVDVGQADVVLEGGVARLSLRNLNGETTESIQEMVESFARSLSGSNLALSLGCARCNCLDAQLIYSDGVCSRLCSDCLNKAIAQRDAEASGRKIGSIRQLLLFPFAFLYASIGWWICWSLLESLLEWRKNDDDGLPIIFAIFIGIGMALGLGVPMGLWLKRSGVARMAPRFVGAAMAVGACVFGEFLHVTFEIYWHTGTVDPGLAAMLFVPMFTDYGTSWIAFKTMVATGFAAICLSAISGEKKVPLRL